MIKGAFYKPWLTTVVWYHVDGSVSSKKITEAEAAQIKYETAKEICDAYEHINWRKDNVD